MKEKHENWSHPLAFWLCDCAAIIPNPATQNFAKNDFLDGLLMLNLMKFINPHFSENEKNGQSLYEELLNQISQFYEKNLDQVIVCKMPEISILESSGEIDEITFEELKKLLLLLLGCAIQSDHKKVFVDRITGFDQTIQAELAACIQKLTESDEIVQNLEDFERRKMKETDEVGGGGGSIEDVDSDDMESSTTSSSNGEIAIKQQDQSFLMSRSTSPTSELRHQTLQIANLQHEMRQMRTQAENRDEECQKLELDNEEKAQKIKILENERLKLVDFKKKWKSVNDDLQEANCKIEKLQNLVGIEKKYREARDGKELYKSKYDIVVKKNLEMEETITTLEKNLKTLQMEMKEKFGVEDNLQRMRNTIDDLEAEISKKNLEIEDFLDEKHRMDREIKELKEIVHQMEVPSTTTTPRIMDSLADQLENAKQDEFEMMKAEIRKLRAQTEGATPETTIIQCNQDLDTLRSQLSTEQHQTAQLHLEIQKMQVEKEQIDGNMERIGIELEEMSAQVENLNLERDEAVKQLLEARRKFGEFQMGQSRDLEEKWSKEVEKSNKISKKCEILEEKLQESDFLLAKSRDEAKKLQFELDEALEETSHVTRSLSSEKNTLKAKLLELQDQVEAQTLELLNQKNCGKRLEDRDQMISNLHNLKNELENDLKTCQTQLELESKKLQRLREDLVLEKSRRADLIGRIHSLCTTLSLNGANFEKINNDDELIDNIDDIMMNALVAVKRERDDLRIQGNQQIQELHDLKRDIEKLRRSESESLNESDDRVRELTRENMHTKEQVFMLQEKLRELNLELSTKNDEIDMVKASIEELNRNSTASCTSNAEIARLQVSIRNSQIQEDLVKQENTKLRDELQEMQKMSKKRSQNLDELENMHKTLLVDHSRLQQLHNLLTRDYDEAKKESMELRQKVQNIPRQQAVFMNANIRELEAKLSEEISRREQLEKEHKMCRIHCENLRRDITELVQTRDELSLELRRAHDTCHNKNNQIDELKKQLNQKISEVNKLSSKIEALSQLNRTYNEENRNLSRQLEILLTQNKELLQRALHDKDQYHLEMKDFQDQLSALRRHKEKLEDKIMDQYRTMENKKSTPERKQPLVKRAAKALINRRRATSNGGSTTEDSSVYSADERSSPPLAGNSTCSVSTSSDSTPDECPLHGSRSFSKISALKIQSSPSPSSSFSRFLSLRRTAKPSLLQGAYTNPNVRKMIDYHYNCSD
ncbi:Girdin homolog [Caenorhabditis elegans]|uniref:Isoform b of Girdin homolog n=1 Tax=Caenorhabditis elegans TaxID=6239 RepID=F3Y5P4-2|nr:Girdin homolog [Caenorhabditis elegans]CAA16402.2 Girdin homolog [Caenorhabditis elegans]|eukprot:NP_001256817.1 Girdin homolog [Caenorhabditis elegans]